MIEKNENDSDDASAASFTTKFKEWHAQGTKKAKGFLSIIKCVVAHYFFLSYLNHYRILDLSNFVHLNYLLIEILK